jgi:hypothetical protein
MISVPYRVNENMLVSGIDRKIIDKGIFGRDGGRQFDNLMQFIRLNIPTNQLRRNAATHPVIQHPY